jgi:hypothetical protein
VAYPHLSGKESALDPNQFDDRLSRLAELSDEELAALETEMLAAFDAADSAGDIAQMQALADSLDQVRAEKANRGGEAAPEAPAEAAPAATPPAPAVAASGKDDDEDKTSTAVTVETDGPDVSIKTTGPDGTSVTVENAGDAADGAAASDAPPDDLPDDPDDPVDPDLPDDDTVADATVDPINPDEEEAVKVTNADVPEGNQPLAASSAPQYAITAGGDIPNITAGAPLADMDAVIDAMTKKVNSMRGVSGGGEQVIVASFKRDLEDEYGDDRILRRGDGEGNSAKVRKYLKNAGSVDALVATGWCAPKTPLYDVPGIGTTDTPVADSLASFGVDRGGIIWTEPPTLPNVSAGLANLGFWQNTSPPGQDPVWAFVPGIPGTDTVGAAAPEKPCFEIECGFEHQAELAAIPLCMCFDNLTTRTYPEYVKATTDLVMIGQARFKEQWLLAQMFGAAGVQSIHGGQAVGNPDVPLGVVRDFLIVLRLAVAQFRWRNRLGNQQLRLYAPAWLRDAMASDLMVQIPGDDTLSTSDSELNGYISECGISDPVWYIDDLPVMPGAVAPTTAGSNFDSYHGYPAQAEWLITLPGVFTRLDGGSLDLGVVRTKEDVQKNKYCEFAETFEAVAYMGPTNPDYAWAMRGTTNVTIRGGFTPAVASVPAGGVIFE